MVAQLLVFFLATATAGVAAVVLSTAPAGATHFRAAEMSWNRSSPTTSTVVLEATWSFRRDYGGWTSYNPSGGGTVSSPNVGDVVQDGNTKVYFGDGRFVNPFLLVTTVDAANNVLTVEALNGTAAASGYLQHIYPNATGGWVAEISGCCRLGSPSGTPQGGHINNPDKSTLVRTIVNLASGNLSSLSSSLPPIVDCPPNSPCNFTIPVSLPAGMTAAFRLSTASEATDLRNFFSAGSFEQPGGAAISASGLFTWNRVRIL